MKTNRNKDLLFSTKEEIKNMVKNQENVDCMRQLLLRYEQLS